MQIIRGNFNIQLSKKTKGNFLLVFGSKMFSIDVKPIYCIELDQTVSINTITELLSYKKTNVYTLTYKTFKMCNSYPAANKSGITAGINKSYNLYNYLDMLYLTRKVFRSRHDKCSFHHLGL